MLKWLFHKNACVCNFCGLCFFLFNPHWQCYHWQFLIRKSILSLFQFLIRKSTQSHCQFLISKLIVLPCIISYIDTDKILLFHIAGVTRQGFSLEVNAQDYGFQPTDTPRTDRSVKFSKLFVFLLFLIFYPIFGTYQKYARNSLV